MESATTAVVFDPHPLWLDAVETVLARLEIEIVKKTTSLADALDCVRECRPSLIVADLEVTPETLEGPDFLRRSVALSPGLRSIVLSADSRAESIEAALVAGASAYVLKSAHPDDLASAIRQAFNSSIFFAPLPRVRAPLEQHPSPVDERGLTKREVEILCLAAEGNSNSELARMLWVTEQTVKFHLSNVYRKLGVSNRTEAALWAHTSGLLDVSAHSQVLTPVG
jgi:DNA-binding NarL/FixJ family response regulator